MLTMDLVVGMRHIALFGALTLACSAAAQALSLSPAHLSAAERLSCVLADDALGFMTEAQFNERFDDAVRGFDTKGVDIIYAKALGYVDGLLFGARAGEEATARLQALSGSETCSVQTAAKVGTARRVAL
ncbi:MAG: hypothetical protein AAF933_11300 [Pseudomonadota bacterium]